MFKELYKANPTLQLDEQPPGYPSLYQLHWQDPGGCSTYKKKVAEKNDRFVLKALLENTPAGILSREHSLPLSNIYNLFEIATVEHWYAPLCVG